MTGPWEDYAPPIATAPAAPSSPPWEDFQEQTPSVLPTSQPVAQASEGPWADFGAPAEPQRASFAQSIERGMRQVEGMVGSAIEYAGERTGIEAVRQYGKEGRRASAAAVQALPPAQRFSDIRGVGDFGQWVKESVGEFIPQIAATTAGAGVGALAVPAAPAVGVTAGVVATSLPFGVGEVQQSVKEKDPNAVAPLAPIVGGAAIAALDSVLPAKIGTMLVRSLGRPVAEQVAALSLRRIGVEAGKDASIEGVTEAVQEAIGEVAGAFGADKPIDWAGLPSQMLEAGAKGFLLGGLAGGGSAIATSQPHTAEPAGERPSLANDSQIATSSAYSSVGIEPGSIRVVDNPDQQAEANAFDTIVEDQQREPSPVFYSQLEKLVRDKGPSFASGEQWMNTIRNWTQQGVKQEEIDYLKLPEYLADKAGRIAKADLLTHIGENLIDVQTTELRAQEGAPLEWHQNGDVWLEAGGELQIERTLGRLGERFQVTYADTLDDVQSLYSASNLADAQRYAQEWANDNPAPEAFQPRYKRYQLAGSKSNYTELLLRWNRPPSPEELAATEAEAAYMEAEDAARAFSEDISNKYGRFSLAPQEVQKENDRLYDEVDRLYRKWRGLSDKGKTRDFRDGHWDQANVLAHVRASRRVDAMGKQVLYIEEIQSDWHQTGRKEGYAANKPIATSTWRVSRIQRPNEWGPIATHERITVYDSRTNEPIMEVSAEAMTDEQAIEAARQEREFMARSAVPDAPFKGSAWVELAVKRILRYAADQGLDRVAFTNPQVQSRRWDAPEGSARAKGFEEFYGKIVPRIVEKWAKKLGGKTGQTMVLTGVAEAPSAPRGWQTTAGTGAVGPTEAALYVDLTPQMRSRVQLGFTTFDIRASDEGPGTVKVVGDPKDDLWPAAQKAAEVVQQLARRFNITKPIRIDLQKGLSGRSLGNVESVGVPTDDLILAVNSGFMTLDKAQSIARQRVKQGLATNYVMRIWPDKFETVEEMYSNMMHELGHIIHFEFYSRAKPETQLAIRAAYEKFFQENSRPQRRFRELLAARQTFIRIFYNNRATLDPTDDPLVSELSSPKYWLSFTEWMAETTSKYMTTNPRPLSVVDRFFSGLATRIRQIRAAFEKKFNLPVNPPDALSKWLDSLITLHPLDIGAVEAQRNRATQEANQKAAAAGGHPDFPATPQTPESFPIRKLIEKLGLTSHPAAGMHLAATDRFNTFYKYMLSLVQVAARNAHIEPLQRYRELWQLKALERANLMNIALETRRMWGKLSRDQSDRVAKMMDWYANGYFLPDDEAAAGVVRRPTAKEEADMVARFGVSEEGWALFNKVQQDFDRFLAEVEAIEVAEAQQITDPVAQARALQATQDKFNEYRKRPYMPFMRYGEFTLSVRDAAGNLTGFYTFESERKRRAARGAIEHDLLPGERILEGVLPEEVRPLMGLPPGLLDKVRDRLGLTQSQIAALEQLKFDYAPVQSFKHRFARRNATPGYSLDFQRGYLNYFFFGSNYLTNVKYAQPLMDQIKAVRDSAKPLEQGTRRGRIANFMTDHYRYTMDPKADWATFRQMASVWALGAVPAAATLNLSQMVVGSYPFLASKFGGLGVGDGRAIRAMTKAGSQLSTYYRRGNLEAAGMTEADLRALSEGVKEGIITEAMAHELAAAAEADNLRPYQLSRIKEYWNFATEKAMWMFEMTEQMNRRISFRAAWKLALEHPNMPYVQQAVVKHRLAYERLLEKGWARNEAAAFVVAKDTVEETQYIYQQWANPRFMRGKARTVFIFKSFVQNTLFMLWNNPGARSRSMLVMAFLGGLMGVPGGEDLRGLLKALAWHLFGKDFDLEEEARRYVLDILGGKVPPDLILHGAARRGFGLPAAMDLVGVPFPTFDRSRAIGLGNILPVDLGVLAGPHKDTSRAIAESTQKASGAAFGLGFNLYKFLTDTQLDWNDSRRWQQVLPRSLTSAAKAWRYYSREEEVNRFGNRVVRFDTDDPRHLAEIIGASMGYTPMRVSAQWDRIIAEREAVMYWNIRRETLLRQAYAARRDPREYESMLQNIRNFNAQLPNHAQLKKITADVLRRSFQTREQTRRAQESGTPRQRADIPIVREIQRLYPEAEVDVRRVR